MAWRRVELGAIDGPTMVNLFVAVAGFVGRGASPPTLLSVHPKAPFANVGFHQEADREIDLDYCRGAGIPVVRRVVGGGAILDGPWEQDYMVIVPNGAPGTEQGVAGFYEAFLAPIAATLGRFGVPTERSGVNDLATRGKKVSANGALLLDGAWVLAGDILLDLDTDLMARVLRVPDEKFRAKLATSMSEWLTSVKAETGRLPAHADVAGAVREEYARAFGIEIVDGALTPNEEHRLDELRRERSKDAWTFLKDASHPRLRGQAGGEPGRSVKVAADTFLGRADLKAGKLVRATVLHRAGRIEEVELSGDFFTVPFSGEVEALESSLSGQPLDPAALDRVVAEWLSRSRVQLVGIGPKDIVCVVLTAAGTVPARG